jgi:hypothetical protein
MYQIPGSRLHTLLTWPETMGLLELAATDSSDRN